MKNKEEEKLRKTIRSKKSSSEEKKIAHCELESSKNRRRLERLKNQ